MHLDRALKFEAFVPKTLEFKRSKLKFLKKCTLYAKKCHTQVVQVHLQPFRRNSFFKMCVAVRNRQKIH